MFNAEESWVGDGRTVTLVHHPHIVLGFASDGQVARLSSFCYDAYTLGSYSQKNEVPWRRGVAPVAMLLLDGSEEC
jgi:hypothetical protein